MEDSEPNTDTVINPQLTDKFFLEKPDNIFDIHSTGNHLDLIIDAPFSIALKTN